MKRKVVLGLVSVLFLLAIVLSPGVGNAQGNSAECGRANAETSESNARRSAINETINGSGALKWGDPALQCAGEGSEPAAGNKLLFRTTDSDEPTSVTLRAVIARSPVPRQFALLVAGVLLLLTTVTAVAAIGIRRRREV